MSPSAPGAHEISLVPLTADSLRALAGRPDQPLTQPGLVGMVWPSDDRRVLRYRAEALTADPRAARWLLHVAVDREGLLVGRIGCHAAPVAGRVEIGYYVRPGRRGQGAATQLLRMFAQWLASNGVRTVVLSIAPANAASLRIARRARFREVGERYDDEDGVELVLERDLDSPPRPPAPDA